MSDYVAELCCYAFPSGRTGEVRARLRRRADGTVRADLRRFARNPSGQLVPTKSGVSVDVADLAELSAAVAALREQAQTQLEDAIADSWDEIGEATL